MKEPGGYPAAIYEARASRMIQGQIGLFTLKSFEKGDVVIPNSNWDEGTLISWEDYEKIDPSTQRQLIFFCYKTAEGIHAPKNINKLNIGYFVNHSCEPMLFCDSDGHYVANRKIEPNEELTIDVEKLMEKTIFCFDCHCGSKNCRKKVRI